MRRDRLVRCTCFQCSRTIYWGSIEEAVYTLERDCHLQFPTEGECYISQSGRKNYIGQLRKNIFIFTSQILFSPDICSPTVRGGGGAYGSSLTRGQVVVFPEDSGSLSCRDGFPRRQECNRRESGNRPNGFLTRRGGCIIEEATRVQRGPITRHFEMRALGKRNVKPSSRRDFRQVSDGASCRHVPRFFEFSVLIVPASVDKS